MKYKVIENINPNIFRGYDIRAIYGKDLDENIAYTIGLAYAKYIRNNGYDRCVIGRDNRSSSLPLSEALIQGIIEGDNIEVIDIGLVTTPMYYYGQIFLNDGKNIMPGIMITASHNPKEYNGMKMTVNDFGNACGEMIQQFRRFVEENSKKEVNNERDVIGHVVKENVREGYLNLVKKSIDLGDKKIKAVVDTANGTASIIAQEMFDMFKDKIEMIPLYMESDPEFPNHHPDPSVESNNEDLKKAVLENKADLGIGIDGDGDRVGIIDENGKMIFADFYAIIVWRYLMDKVTNKKALFDVKCTKSLADEIEKLGGTPVCYRTGNSYMKAKMRDDDFMFGSELSGHVWFRDKWPNIDDGLYAGLRLIEIMSKTGKSITKMLEGINKYYSTPEIKFEASDDVKFKIIEKIKEYCIDKGYKINDIDGVRAEFDNGWALVRASNTGPNITARFEGKTEEDMEKIKDEFIGLIK
jgi:phosphomannomutase/phosphoglucomutase